MANLNDIFGWFGIGKRPTAQQFRDTFSSFIHRSERLPLTQILGLNDSLTQTHQLINQLDQSKASKEDLASVAVGGLNPMGDVDKYTDLAIKPKRHNDSYFVHDRLDENGDPYIFRYDAELDEWINTKQVVYKDVVKQPQIIDIKSQINFTTAFAFTSAKDTASRFDLIWCNDYPATSAKGIAIKTKTGTINIYKFNLKTKEYSLIKTVISNSAIQGITQQILFEKEIVLDTYDRIGVNGDVYFSLDATIPLYPHVYTYNFPSGNLINQKDITIAYNLITSDKDKIQLASDSIEAIKYNLSMGESISPTLPNLAVGSGYGGVTLLTTCSALQSKYTGQLTEITARVKANIDNVIVLYSIINNKAYEKDRFIMRSPVDGIRTMRVDARICRGDFLGFFRSSTRFGSTIAQNQFNSRFLQTPIPNSTASNVNVDGYIGLSYKVKVDNSIENEVIQNGFETGSFYRGSVLPDSVYTSFDSNKWITFNNDIFSYEGIIKKIWIDIETPGDISIGIGLIDQRGWSIIDEETVINCPEAGVNEILTNISLPKNKRLFIKTPISIGVLSGGFHLETQPDDIVLSAVSGEINFRYEIEGRRYVESNIPSKTDIESIQSDLLNINSAVNTLSLDVKYKQSPDGSFWTSIIDNNGQQTWVKVNAKKIGVLGNSFERHGITSYWWGIRGMASSTKENDWCHKLVSKLRAYGILATISVQNIVDWEKDASTFDYSTLDNILIGSDLVIIRIGENNPNSPTLTADTKALIDYVRTKVSNVPIIFGGVFWTNQSKQAKMKAAVDQYADIPFIDFQILDRPEYKSSVGNLVFGDDGQWHTINDSGVANHSGDLGFDKMSDMILPKAFEFLK